MASHRSSALPSEFRTSGLSPLIAHYHLGLGKLYRRIAKHDQSRKHLATATTMYREMDMRFYLKQAEAERA